MVRSRNKKTPLTNSKKSGTIERKLFPKNRMQKIDRRADVVIIGFGSAGMRAYKAAKKHTESVLIVHDGPYGTTCARTGCMPSKLLIAAADTAEAVRQAEIFGIHPRGLAIDEAAVMQRVRDLRDFFVASTLEHVEAIPEADRLRGRGRFLDANTIAVGDEIVIKAKTVVIATGSVPIVPPEFPAGSPRVLTTDQLFDWQALPASVAVFGTGVIGLELGQALSRLGVKTTVFGRSGRVSSFADPKLLEMAAAIFREELTVYPASAISTMTEEAKGIRIRFRDGQEEHDIRYEFVLAAVGRAPALAGLDLFQTGIPLDARGIPLCNPETMRCGESNIFLAGDADGFRQLLHEAADEGDIAGKNAALFPLIASHPRRVPLGIVFTDPGMASVGKTLAELSPDNTVTGTVDFTHQPRAKIMGKNRGLLSVYADRASGRLLGAEMICPAAEHLAHLIALAIERKLSVSEMLSMPFYHPTLEEGLKTALQNAAKQLKR